jgi:hypothetical protein
MAGLNSIISNTGTQTTSMPSWYTDAQKAIVNQASAANAAVPAPQNTVAQNAVNTLSGPTNPFTQAGNTLQSIASGAANPFNVDPNTGVATPNTNTALGGLFSAQQNQLNQLLPTINAPVQASNIGSGNFGSLRGQTALDASSANALAQLQSAQMQAALQNQSAGVSAGVGAGNVAQQDINNLLTTGQYQQASPYINAANYGNVLSTVQPGSTVSNTTNLSPLNQVGGLITALSGATGSGGILNQLGVTGGLSGVLSKIGSIFSGTGGSSSTSTDYTNGSTTNANNQSVMTQDANGNYTDSLGNVFNDQGTLVQDANGNTYD